MVAVPALIPEIIPLLTVATLVLLDVQVTFLLLALCGSIVATNCVVAPTLTETELLFNEIPVTSTLPCMTVIVAVAVLPLLDRAVILAVPAERPMTLPLSTTATFVLLLDQEMVLLVAFVGKTVAVNLIDEPALTLALV